MSTFRFGRSSVFLVGSNSSDCFWFWFDLGSEGFDLTKFMFMIESLGSCTWAVKGFFVGSISTDVSLIFRGAVSGDLAGEKVILFIFVGLVFFFDFARDFLFFETDRPNGISIQNDTNKFY